MQDGSPDFGIYQVYARAVSPLLEKDATGTPEVPAPVVRGAPTTQRQRQRQRQIPTDTETEDRDRDRDRQREERERERETYQDGGRDRDRQREERERERENPALHRPKWAGARLSGVSLINKYQQIHPAKCATPMHQQV